MSAAVGLIEFGDYIPEPCPKNICGHHQAAQLHNLTTDGVEHVGYVILCNNTAEPSWLAWSPSIAVWDHDFRISMGSLRRD